MDKLIQETRELLLVESKKIDSTTGIVQSTKHGLQSQSVRMFFGLISDRASRFSLYMEGNSFYYKFAIPKSRNGISYITLVVSATGVRLLVHFTKKGYKEFVVERELDRLSKTDLFKDTTVDYSHLEFKEVVSKPKTFLMTGKDGEEWNIPMDWITV